MSRTGRSLFKRALSCSFCGKSERDVARLIAGPSVFICDACVGLCVGILEHGGPAPEPSAPTRRLRLFDRVRDWLATRADSRSYLLGVLK